MSRWNEITFLLQKEFRSEWKRSYAIGGLLLYVISTVFICKLSFQNIPDALTWSAVFWIILLFAALNAVAKSFLQETRGRILYHYTLASPQAIILSRILYHCLLMIVLSLICYLFFSLLIGDPILNPGMFIAAIVLGSIGFACVLTLVSAIASKTNNNFTIMAILSFPVMLPLLLLLIKITKFAIDNVEWTICFNYLLALFALNIVISTLAYLLFPYLWRD